MENVEKTNNMFSGCGNLHDIDFSNFKNNKVTNTSYMFSGCSSLKTIDLSGFDTSHVTNMRNMFYGCSKLEKIYASDKFVTTSIDAEKDVNMFLDCSSVLKGGMGTT